MYEVRSRNLGHDIVAMSEDLLMAKIKAEDKRRATGQHYDIYEVKQVWTTQTVNDLINEVKF